MRRLLAAASLAALSVSLAVPLASAHPDTNEHTMAWGADPNPTTARDGAQVFSNDEVVAAFLDFDDGVKSWDVVIRPVNGGQPSTCHEDLAQDGGEYPRQVYINCPWDTTRAKNRTLPGATAGRDAANPKFSRTWQTQDLGPSVNGRYTIEITAYNAGQRFSCGLITGCETRPVEPHPLYQSGSNPPRWREVWVTNGVGAPTGLTNGYDPGTNKITVTWAPNPEPDASYIVQERVGDGKWSSGAAVPTGTTRYERSIEHPGTYQYRVAAVRPSPTREDEGATRKSEYVATQVVEIAQVTPPTTAGASADGVSDGPDPGVSVPTDPTSPTGASGPSGSAPGARRPTPGRTTVGGFVASRPRPSGASGGTTGSTAGFDEEVEGEGPDEGFSSFLPYTERQGEAEGEFVDEEEDGPQTLAGGVVPKPRDARALLVPMAIALTLFVFSMQMIVLLRRRPAMATNGQDDFDDWIGF